MKRALITGVTGQDGSYLAELLVDKGYEVFGLVRRTSNDPLARIEDAGLSKTVKILHGNMRDINTISRAMEASKPDEVYNLAAQSHVGVSFECPEETLEVNYYGVGRIVNEAIRVNPKVRVYQASTSEMFGLSAPPQNENTPFNPLSPYAEAKLKAHQDFVAHYREKYNIFICSGILFNHESPRRGKQFVTRKITHSLAKIKLGIQDCFDLGHLDSRRDWGFAGDYVRAMWMMLQKEKPEDFVVATGVSYSVRDFVDVAASMLGINIHWEGEGVNEVGKGDNGKVIVRVNPAYYRPTDPSNLIGDSAKARMVLGWQPTVDFRGLVKMMTEADLIEVQRQALDVNAQI